MKKFKDLKEILALLFVIGCFVFITVFVLFNNVKDCPLWLSLAIVALIMPRILLGFFLFSYEIEENFLFAIIEFLLYYCSFVFIYLHFFPVEHWYSSLIRFSIYLIFFVFGLLYSRKQKKLTKEKEETD